VTVNEDETGSIPVANLEENLDGDPHEYSVTSTSNGITARFENNQLKFTGTQNNHGTEEVNYSINDGDATANGKVTVNITSVYDAPTITNLTLTPTSNVFVGDTLWVNYDFNSVEGAAEGPTEIDKYIDNQQAGQTQTEKVVLTNDMQAGNADVRTTPIDANGVAGTEVISNTVVLQTKPYLSISGNITELFEEGVNIAGANVQFGSFNTTTGTHGEYRLEIDPGTLARLIIEHPDFYRRETSSFTAKDTTLDETMVEGTFNMEHYDAICRRRGQTSRFVTPPTVYVDTSPALNPDGSTTPVPQNRIDDALEVIADISQFAVGLYPNDQVNIEVGTNPPAWGTNNYIIFSWDNTIPGKGEHGEYVSSDVINSAISKVKTNSGKGVMRQEISQNYGARKDSNILDSIFNDPLGFRTDYTNNDLKIGKFLYKRKPSNASPDKDL